MPIKIDSTTDSEEAVTAALGNLAPEKEDEQVVKPASQEADEHDEDENAEDSGDSEGEEDSEAADDGGESDDEDEEQKPEEKPKKRGGFKKRIDKLTRKLSAKEQEIEYWKQEALKQKKQEPSEPVEKKADSTAKPVADDFDSHEEYVEALTDWKLEQTLKARESKQKEAQVKTEFERQVQSHAERVKSFAEAHDDFYDVIEEVDDIPMSVTVQEVILASENGAELMYELAKSPEEYARICKLPAIAAARELGRLEARIQRASDSRNEAKQAKKTKAPPPITPVRSKSSAVSTKSPEEMSYQDFKRWREAQLK